MAAAAGIFNHQAITAAQQMAGKTVAPMDDPSSGSSGSGSSTSDSATITANDFLTLLVTEMQNQDPTSQTDPNEYINQLVQVNSLEQLISINQTLTGALDPSASSSTDTATDATGAASAAGHANALAAVNPANAANAASTSAAAQPPAGGNLGVPATHPAALRVAHALDGRFQAGS